MKEKIMSKVFITLLVVWVFSAVYLSINSIFGIFMDTNPNISKAILGFSFLGMVGSGIVNKFIGNDLNKIGEDLKQKGCKTCKQKNKNGNV
jgi:hypothetical protein